MTDLSQKRLDVHLFPFINIGVIYFVHFDFKFLRRALKQWFCFFNCLTSRTSHIEVAQSFDTESCLAAVTRFIARRGYPNTKISDNGTNFIGAANELRASMNKRDEAIIESDLAQRKIVWKFNPPGASHLEFGIWWKLGETGSKVQEEDDCNLGQPKHYR